MSKRTLTLALAIVAINTAAFLGGWLLMRRPAPALPAPASLADTPYAHLAEDLASAQPADRVRGTQALAQLTPRDRPILQQLIAQTTDPAALDTLRAQLVRLDFAAQVELPPISLSLKDATLAEVATALAQATHSTMSSLRDPANPTFTLDAQDLPYWSIFDQLSRQHVLYPTGTGSPTLRNGNFVALGSTVHKPPHEPHYLSDCGFVSFSRGTRAAMSNGSTPQLPPGELCFDFTLAADPRLLVWDLTWGSTSITVGTTNLTVSRNAAEPGTPRFRPRNVFEPFAFAHVPDALRGQKATLHIQATAKIVVSKEIVELTDPEKHIGETITMAAGNFTLKSFSATGRQVTFALTQSTPSPPFITEITDATGTVLASIPSSGGINASIGRAYTPPVKIQFIAPAKILEVPLSIQLDDYDL